MMTANHSLRRCNVVTAN